MMFILIRIRLHFFVWKDYNRKWKGNSIISEIKSISKNWRANLLAMANNFTLHFLKKLKTFAFRDRLSLVISISTIKEHYKKKWCLAGWLTVANSACFEKGTSTEWLVPLMGQTIIHSTKDISEKTKEVQQALYVMAKGLLVCLVHRCTPALDRASVAQDKCLIKIGLILRHSCPLLL